METWAVWQSRRQAADKAVARSRGSAGGILRHLSRTCARNRTSSRPKRNTLQHWLRDCHRVLARAGNWHRHGPSVGMGTEVLRVAGAAVAFGGVFFMWRALA